MAKQGERDPKSLADLVPTLVAGRGWGARMAFGRLRESWAAVVGEQIAAHSEPVHLERDLLTVTAEAGSWATELTLLAPMLAEKAGAFLGVGDSLRVRIVASVRASARAAETGRKRGHFPP